MWLLKDFVEHNDTSDSERSCLHSAWSCNFSDRHCPGRCVLALQLMPSPSVLHNTLTYCYCFWSVFLEVTTGWTRSPKGLMYLTMKNLTGLQVQGFAGKSALPVQPRPSDTLTLNLDQTWPVGISEKMGQLIKNWKMYVEIVAKGEDSRSEQRDAADCVPAVSGKEWERHTTNCTGNAGGSPACHHGQHDCRGLSFAFQQTCLTGFFRVTPISQYQMLLEGTKSITTHSYCSMYTAN